VGILETNLVTPLSSYIEMLSQKKNEKRETYTGQHKNTSNECELPNLVFYFSMFSVCIRLVIWNRIITNYFKIDLSIFLLFFIGVLEHFVLLNHCCLSVKFVRSLASLTQRKRCVLCL